ncbi:MAG: glycogen synthase GlgA [Betaproteobacteria bacterium]|nr:glycogen synthase GlgA [Betaproteobacteria bacterium]
MRILQVSAEIFPLLKTGGLADIAGALPAALHEAGCDVRVLLPGFPAIVEGLRNPSPVGAFVMPWGEMVEIVYGDLPALARGDMQQGAYVLMAPGLYERPGNPYEDANKQPYGDNHRRFAALGQASAHLAHGMDSLWRAQLVHSHDWHAGLASAYLKLWADRGATRVPSVFTVHNLAYQGVFGPQYFGDLGLPGEAFHVQGMEFHGQLSFMKAGLFYASHITTVSPTYAREIQTPEQGCGLDGLLMARREALSGILNAVDDTVWNPTSDALLEQNFDARHMAGKAINKAMLQGTMGLGLEPDAPLFAVVSRLTEQKGLPLVLAGLDEIVSRGGQLLVLGSGDTWLEQAFTERAKTHAGRVAVKLGYDESFAHRVFAGSDVTLVPSRFEPCGLTQMYGLKYGSLPLVRRVGGLADTVVDSDLETLEDRTATGFVFDAFDETAYRKAVRRAFALYHRKAEWNRVRQTGMKLAFDWATAAGHYTHLYQRLIQE